jgi:hypothetical protein
MPYHFSSFLPFHFTDVSLDFPTWVFRGERFMAGYDPLAKKLLWRYTLKQDNLHEGRKMYRHRDFLITSYLNDTPSGQAWLIAFHPETGKVIWNTKAIPDCMTNRGKDHYFYQTDHYIMYPDYLRKVTVVLDADTGKEVGTLPPTRYHHSFCAGDYTYVYHDKVLLRIPRAVRELPKSWEEVPVEGYIVEVVVQGDRVLVISSGAGEEQGYLIQYMNADTWEEQSRIFLRWPTHYDPKLIASSQPGKILLQLDQKVASLDLELPVVHWEKEWKKSPDLLWTDHGIIGKIGFDETFTLDPVTGERQQSRQNLEYQAVAQEDLLITNSSAYQIPWFLDGDEEAGTDAAERIKSRIEEMASELYLGFTFVMHHRDSPATPPDETMVAALPEAGDILSQLDYEIPRKEVLWKQLEASFEKFLKDKDVDRFSKSLVKILGIKEVHPDIRQYFAEGLESKKIKGYKKPLGHLYKMRNHFLTCKRLIGFGPDDELFPGIYDVGYTSSGIEYILMLEDGKVLDIHHDSLVEYAWDYEDEMEESHLKFARVFSRRYGKGPLDKWRPKKKKES